MSENKFKKSLLYHILLWVRLDICEFHAQPSNSEYYHCCVELVTQAAAERVL